MWFRTVLYYPFMDGKMVGWYNFSFLEIVCIYYVLLRIWLEIVFSMGPYAGRDDGSLPTGWRGIGVINNMCIVWNWEWTVFSRIQLTSATGTVGKRWYITRLPPQVQFVEHWMNLWTIQRGNSPSRASHYTLKIKWTIVLNRPLLQPGT